MEQFIGLKKVKVVMVKNYVVHGVKIAKNKFIEYINIIFNKLDNILCGKSGCGI